jgi:hypothetical protein
MSADSSFEKFKLVTYEDKKDNTVVFELMQEKTGDTETQVIPEQKGDEKTEGDKPGSVTEKQG